MAELTSHSTSSLRDWCRAWLAEKECTVFFDRQWAAVLFLSLPVSPLLYFFQKRPASGRYHFSAPSPWWHLCPPNLAQLLWTTDTLIGPDLLCHALSALCWVCCVGAAMSGPLFSHWLFRPLPKWSAATGSWWAHANREVLICGLFQMMISLFSIQKGERYLRRVVFYNTLEWLTR